MRKTNVWQSVRWIYSRIRRQNQPLELFDDRRKQTGGLNRKERIIIIIIKTNEKGNLQIFSNWYRTVSLAEFFQFYFLSCTMIRANMSCPLLLVEGKLKITFSYSLSRESHESFVVCFEPIIRKHCSLLLTINSALFILF